MNLNIRRMRSVLVVGLLLSLTILLSAQELQIHYINVQQGKSTLIIGPDGTTLLYDGGNTDKGYTEIAPYLESLGIDTTQALDYMVVSHHHTDHYRGLTEILLYGYDVAKAIYDNGSDYTNDPWEAFVAAAQTTTAGGLTTIQLGDVIDLGGGATATCVAVNGNVIGVGPIDGALDNESDRSIGLLVEYGDFDYIILGDNGGGEDDNACTGRSTQQVNIETPLVYSIMPGGANPLLNSFGVEVANVSHHGSESSTNSDYMNLLTPSVACINVGDGQGANWNHPRKDVVENVLLAQASCITAPPALVLQTEEGNPTGRKTSFAGYCVGDIIITTDGTTSFTVDGTGAVSQGPDERADAGLPKTFPLDEVEDTSAPVISNVRAENVTGTSAEIAWDPMNPPPPWSSTAPPPAATPIPSAMATW